MHLILTLLLLASPAAAPNRFEPVRLSAPAFGAQVDVEVRGLPKSEAEAAVAEALREVAAFETSTDPEGAGSAVAALNAKAGAGPQKVDLPLGDLLSRALDFCQWTEGAHGPLGRGLYRLWGLRSPAAALPDDAALEPAATAAACPGLRYDAQKGTATLAAGAGIDLWGFAEGAAVDRAVEALKRHKAPTGFVQLAGIRRGFGPGPTGRGWRVLLPVFEGLDQPLGEVWLRDQSLAVAAANQRSLRIGGETYPPYVNQRNGKPSTGVLAAITGTELAVDALALAATAMVLSPHEMQLRLGSLRPEPSILWVLGSGQGAPLLLEYRWSNVHKK